MTYEIDKGMVPPPPQNGSGPAGKYPWPQMEAGDSFFVPFDGRTRITVQSSIASTGHTWCRRHRPDLKAVTRSVTEDGVEGVRVWFVTREDR
jgi:hypothetical protein